MQMCVFYCGDFNACIKEKYNGCELPCKVFFKTFDTHLALEY